VGGGARPRAKDGAVAAGIAAIKQQLTDPTAGCS